MPGSLKNKFISYEVTPPPAVWENISKRLDEEYRPSDQALSSRMENMESVPPPSSWGFIVSALQKDAAPGPVPAPVIPFLRRLPLKRISVAVILVGLAAVSVLYLLTGNQALTGRQESTIVQQAPRATASPAPALPQPQADPGSPARTGVAVSRRRSISHNPKKAQYRPSDYSIIAASNPDIQQAQISALQTVSPLKPVSVKAPLIRDSKGNIIMDLNVISNPGEPYIVVTGPNGHQTRISSKFLPCISYLNSDNLNNELPSSDFQGTQCKTRFEKWRNILSNAAFVPSASNFFDIFELKEMIEEK